MTDYVGLIVIALLVGIIWWVSQLPAARAQQKRVMEADPLVKVVAQIPQPTFAIPARSRRCDYWSKGWQQRHYTCYYSGDVRPGDVERYYGGELESRGWKRVEGYYWCKDGDEASLQFDAAGQSDWNYALHLSHGVVGSPCAR